MRVSPVVAAGLLLLTLGLKLRADVLVPRDDAPTALQRIAGNFARGGYATAVEVAPRTRVTVVRGPCRVVLKLLDPHGTNAMSMIRQLAPEGWIAYARDGVWHASLPRAAPLFNYYFKRELARQGLAAARDPVWLAAIGPGCPARPDARLTDVPVRLVAAA